jgi:MFS family permease
VYLIFTGINISVLYLASIVCLGNYFDKKRAFALGISVCGTGIGTFVIAPLTKYLVDQYSWQGAIFIESAILLNCAVSGALYRPLPITKQQNGRGSEDEKSELYPVSEMENKMIGCSTGANRVEVLVKRDFEIYRKSNVQKIDSCQLSLPQIDIGSKDVCSLIFKASQEKTPLKITDDHDLQFNHTNLNNRTVMQKCNEHFNFVLYLDVAFVLFCMTNSLAGLGTIMPYVYLVDRANEAGIPEVKGVFLLSTAGIANTISRFVFGWIADRPFSNPSYICAGALLICGLSTCLSPLSDSYEFLTCYAALFGACAGIYLIYFSLMSYVPCVLWIKRYIENRRITLPVSIVKMKMNLL